ncbi:MAG: glycosyltransferase family A protein [Candidatus Bathyarchaeia archaeon]
MAEVKAPPNTRGLVSIIIPVHNKVKAERCLREIERQTYPNIEVITVEFKGFPAEKRNYGFRKSRGEYVYFLDEDEYLSPTVVEECVAKAMESYDVVAVPVVKKPTKSYMANSISIIRESTFKTMFFKRRVLEDIGLFDPSFTLCDDLELLERARGAGYKMAAISKGYLIHDEEVGLKDVVYKTLASRRAFRGLKKKYGKAKFNQIVRPVFHRKRIFREILRRPKYIVGVLLTMYIRFITRRLP